MPEPGERSEADEAVRAAREEFRLVGSRVYDDIITPRVLEFAMLAFDTGAASERAKDEAVRDAKEQAIELLHQCSKCSRWITTPSCDSCWVDGRLPLSDDIGQAVRLRFWRVYKMAGRVVDEELSRFEEHIRASERAEQQGREWEIAEAEFQRGYAAGRASERERYAPFIEAAKRVAREVSYGREGFSGLHSVKVAHVDVKSLQAFYTALTALEEAESA